MARENSIKQKRRGLERTKRMEDGGGGADRAKNTQILKEQKV